MLCLWASSTSAEVIEGYAASHEGWAFLGKFVFGVTDPARELRHPGVDECGAQGPDEREEWMQTVAVTVRAPHPSHAVPGLRIYLYDDQEASWPHVYENGRPRSGLRREDGRSLESQDGSGGHA